MNITTSILTAVMAIGLSSTMVSAETSQPEPLPSPLIPLPEKYETDGQTRRVDHLQLLSEEAPLQTTVKTCQALANSLLKGKQHALPVTLVIRADLKHPEAYHLTIPSSGSALIEAGSPAGAFYGVQTLLQLSRNGSSPCARIEDAPRFNWRGLMLDEARHFMGKDYVKHLLRTMAAHKMNRFHWHLTDDQGWRIEIKKYPYLTKTGAWRGPGTNAPVPKWDKDTPLAKKKYGGFYTQEDIKEIVAYASSLHIEIMPEIDVPGHAMAIAIAYPQVLPKQDGQTGKDVHGLKGNVLSVVDEKNYVMLNDIFGEIAALFPSPYIHVGGDEVNVNAWKASPEHRKYMEKHGMKHPSQLQNMFMLRLEKILKSHGKTLMGWNEIMHGGKLSNDTGVMAWISIGAGINAAKHGYPTVMAVGPHNYFDMKYPGHSETGHWWAGIVDTQRAYSWNPLFEDQLKPEQQKNILGVHCALWTEFVPDPENADYKLWPRACATAEVGWTQQNQREWTSFSGRLNQHLDYLDALKVGYRVKPPQAVIAQGKVTINQPFNGPAKILYTTDGSDPQVGSAKTYAGESFDASEASKLRYLTLRPNGRSSKIMKGAIREPIGKWDPSILAKGKTTLDIDVTNTVTAAGNWILDCQYQRGKQATRIHSAKLLANGKVISEANGQTIHGKQRNARLRLPVKSLQQGATYTLALTLEGVEGKDSRGAILLDRSIWIEPDTQVSTKVSHYGNNTPAKAANWVRSDWFWSDRPGRKGDRWEYTFAKPIKVTSIHVPTGKPNSNDDIIVDASIEVSADGKTFRNVGSFAYGTGKAKFDRPTEVKAVRVTLDADHQTWIIVRDLEMK
ncbi:family 20 glycosylhydrolase [Verrucomicrobiaceae bacterium N1E253]|uniref:beta-N-acetylhexosaminidase n=1 Tax=Oceaniferula marina TaxID=2748318 RepID=A0A851GCI4_9BACT|nr:family 20 glycosylhydrolase [Oceaniferula marina]NWK55136.1 family 20 glycosylhydrolase [Oceaniferula marina]